MSKYIYCLISLAFVLSPSFSNSQVISAASVFQWDVKSKKIDERKYELIFTAGAVNGYELYAPGQDLDGVSSAELGFEDSTLSAKLFSVSGNIHSIPSSVFSKGSVQLINGQAVWKAIINFESAVPAKLIGSLSCFYDHNDEFLSDLPFSFNVSLEGGIVAGGNIKINSIDVKHPVNNCGDEGTRNKTLLGIFFLGFLGGLIALITPCVFPMIPVTVTFFTKKTPERNKGVFNAILYGLFIFLIYVSITIPFHIASKTISPEIFNNISTNVWLNIIFFLVFILFAISFFGWFEIGLPSFLANKAGSKSGHTNIFGIFFMAATLAIVSFSCTGPILGTLLANVANEGPWPLTAGAAGFGLALGLPFALFALFPNWLHSLPRSGGWMTTVKVVLGFIELALAVKFLANADNVEQWGLLKREIFIGLWILIGAGLVAYLLGWLKMPHSSPIKRFSFARIISIILFTALTGYLIPGVTNTKWANLSLLSGFPPPLSYSIYKHHVLITEGITPMHNDYEKALAMARKENKPLLIDFTGWACVNCRRMEEKVWTSKEVNGLMRNEFIVVSLYVDERTRLPGTEQTVFKTAQGTDKSITSVGDKWATFQSENFGAASQPQYAIISPDEKALTRTKFYTPDPVEFADWLKCGLQAMKK